MKTKDIRNEQIGFILTLSFSAILVMGLGCKKQAASEPVPTPPVSKQQSSQEAKPAPASETKTVPTPATNSAIKALVFRNIRSWNREQDFEDVLSAIRLDFDVRSSGEMEETDLSPYSFIIIPGAQWQANFYQDYARNAARFDRYVTNGGTLVLELNGAERDGITLPRGPSMVEHGATDNLITLPSHPILIPMGGKPIHANYASHGYLTAVPKDATILVAEMVDNQPALDKPTFVEYAHGKGRIIAACQCFHDRDGSGRGPLMETVISYAADKQWFSKKNAALSK